MHLGDSIIIFIMALILFGPKKLPEMARQLAKLMAEFRRASNEFKTQIDEELRSSEQADRQKEISSAAVANAANLPTVSDTSSDGYSASIEPKILPPSTGAPVSQYAYGDPATTERPVRTRDDGMQVIDAVDSDAGTAVEHFADEGGSSGLPPGEVPSPLSSDFNGLFRESNPTFGIPAAVEATAGEDTNVTTVTADGDMGTATALTADALKAPAGGNGRTGDLSNAHIQAHTEAMPEIAIEGSASENAQAGIPHV